MKKLPLGTQTFSIIREVKDGLVYVDKTKHIWNLLNNPNTNKIFLSRPRRFGKSLLCSTFKSLFLGKKNEFEDLYIYSKWNWDQTNPVIHIMFGTGIVQDGEYLKNQLKDIIIENKQDNNIDVLESKTIAGQFKELLKKIYTKTGKKVVVLIDEYDKPILDKIDKPEVATEIREELKGFYSVLKGADEYLRFVLITGVSKFSQVSLFSGLNQLEDITLKQDYATICGYTGQEILDNFGPEGYLEGVNFEEMKKWYDGYNFNCKSDEDKMYNPFGILNFFSNNNEYLNYWFKTATPTFLIKLLKKNYYPIIDFENIEVGARIMDSFDIENIDLETLMYQTGYLTIKEKMHLGEKIIYKLSVPNKEVRSSLNEYLIDDYLGFTNRFAFDNIIKIYKALEVGNVVEFIEILKTIFAGIPYANYTNNDISKYEGFYSSVLYSFLAGSGLDFVAEDFTNRGRIDLTVSFNNHVYIIELKVEKTGAEALEQIKTKGYEEKYRNSKNKIYLVGLNFDEKMKNIGDSGWEELL